MSVDLRTVNHRFFNPSIKLPSDLARWEAEVRETLRRRIARGHVTLSARTERLVTPTAIDESRFASYVSLLRGLQERYGLGGTVDVATVLRMPDVLVATDDLADGTAAELIAVIDSAVDVLQQSREAEGARLGAVLLDRIAQVDEAVERIAERAPFRLVAQRDRLREQVRLLADGLVVDESRLAQEIAFVADRLDVHEELDRFRSHVEAFRMAVTDATGEPIGKRLGFLLQELLREANTTGSKGNDAVLVQDVLLIKEELERIREQVENLE